MPGSGGSSRETAGNGTTCGELPVFGDDEELAADLGHGAGGGVAVGGAGTCGGVVEGESGGKPRANRRTCCMWN